MFRHNYIDVLEGKDYDPFGMLMVGRSFESGSGYRYGFNSQEQDDEVYGNGNYNVAEFWGYDTRIGRRFNRDQVKIQYLSPYAVLANNPIRNIDLLGNIIDLSLFSSKDKSGKSKKENDSGQDVDYTEELIEDLSAKTGLTLTMTWYGTLEYAKNIDESAVVNVDNEGNELGSQAARDQLIAAIRDGNKYTVVMGFQGSSNAINGIITLDVNQIDELITNTSDGLNSTTMGYALSFFHELAHEKSPDAPAGAYSTGYTDKMIYKTDPAGDVEYFINNIRRQLGEDYGIRLRHEAIISGTTGYIIFGDQNGTTTFPSELDFQPVLYKHTRIDNFTDVESK